MIVREWNCVCGHWWQEEVRYTENANLSGEASVWCPKCRCRPLSGSPHRTVDHVNRGLEWAMCNSYNDYLPFGREEGT